jgi:hypothetical protein
LSLLQIVDAEPDPRQQRAVLDCAYAEAQSIINRNPLDDRAWARVGAISREIALIDPSMKDRALQGNETLVELLLSCWRERLQVRW